MALVTYTVFVLTCLWVVVVGGVATVNGIIYLLVAARCRHRERCGLKIATMWGIIYVLLVVVLLQLGIIVSYWVV